MIQDQRLWEAWERDWLRREPLDAARNRALLEAMYEYARALGAFPPADPLEGIDAKIRLARILNYVPPAS